MHDRRSEFRVPLTRYCEKRRHGLFNFDVFDQVTLRFEIEMGPGEFFFFFPLLFFLSLLVAFSVYCNSGKAVPRRFYMTLIHNACQMTLTKTGNGVAWGGGFRWRGVWWLMNFSRDDRKDRFATRAGGDSVFVLENWLRLRFMVTLWLHQLMLLTGTPRVPVNSLCVCLVGVINLH